MGTMCVRTHQILRSLCLNGDWKYAIFWKLKYRTRMVLTWADAYYKNCEQDGPSEIKCYGNTYDGHFSRDPLGLAVAKMSYQVFSMGEGIIGEVAVTGKHQLISADKYSTSLCSSIQSSEGWQTQFSAGIRTVLVVAVGPHGVIQLGSLNKVNEDMKLVTYIRDSFLHSNGSHLEDSSTKNCVGKSPICLPHLSTNTLASELLADYSCNFSKAITGEEQNAPVSAFPYMGKLNDSSHGLPLHCNHQDTGVESVNKQDLLGLESDIDQDKQLLERKSNTIYLEQQDQVKTKLLSCQKSERESGNQEDTGLGSVPTTPLRNSLVDHADSLNYMHPDVNFGADIACFSSDLFHSSLWNYIKLDGLDLHQDGPLHVRETSDMKLQGELEMKGFETELSHTNESNLNSKLSAVSELHEALKPTFLSSNTHAGWGEDKTADAVMMEMQEGMSSSQLTFDSRADNLLEAVVASVCHGDDSKSDKPFCKSVQYPMNVEKVFKPSNYTQCTIDSSGYSISQPTVIETETQHSMNSSEATSFMSSKGFSSTCPSTCSEQFERSSEPAKNNRKRARPGESGRPRPRDRQLIQDRIKELRELVPNGSKCSIDSLLERTVKHMLFLQNVIQHAEDLNKCADSKMRHTDSAMLESNGFKEGSSWAVEVGNHLRISSIMVENLNKNTQMLVEVVCEDCCHYLEIAEAIKSLGLVIVRGITETHGKKVWLCFVVEGSNNNAIHRMDILWSLVQILQSKSTN